MHVGGIATVRTGHSFDGMPATTYQLNNHLGSVNFRLSDTGSILDREEYYPFGDSSVRTWADNQKRYRYVGKEKDAESGLYYYGARYYSAWTCRFISVDPLAWEYPQLTPFNYAANEPIGDLDIDGMQTQSTEKNPATQSPETDPNAIPGTGKNSTDYIHVQKIQNKIQLDQIADSESSSQTPSTAQPTNGADSTTTSDSTAATSSGTSPDEIKTHTLRIVYLETEENTLSQISTEHKAILESKVTKILKLNDIDENIELITEVRTDAYTDEETKAMTDTNIVYLGDASTLNKMLNVNEFGNKSGRTTRTQGMYFAERGFSALDIDAPFISPYYGRTGDLTPKEEKLFQTQGQINYKEQGFFIDFYGLMARSIVHEGLGHPILGQDHTSGSNIMQDGLKYFENRTNRGGYPFESEPEVLKFAHEDLLKVKSFLKK